MSTEVDEAALEHLHVVQTAINLTFKGCIFFNEIKDFFEPR